MNLMMNANDSFVVVDLETTGQSVDRGGRIIQIGMTFIKKRKIVDHFETFVNPGQLIDRQIQQLTHISQNEVQHAPYFEEIAPVIHTLLKDSVIIAHNVNFDYPYLNEEFERAGLSPLDIPAIDTVMLSQILLPTAPGYRLVDLTQYLDIKLSNAHRANEDAHATAELFLSLWRLAEQLPAQTLQQLQQGQWQLLRQTQAFLQLVRPKRTHHQFTIFNEKIALRQTFLSNQKSPNNASLTLPQVKQHMSFKPAQDKLVRHVSEFIDKKHHGVLTINTPPKSGKTVGYLIPVLLNALKKQTVLLTDDVSLQQQQMQLIHQYCRFFKLPIRASILYEPNCYIDLEKYSQLLTDDQYPAQVQLLKARILVWLTQTKTGLLQEIKIGASNVSWLSELKGHEQTYFFKRAQQNAQVSQIVIMNFEAYFALSQQLLVAKQHEIWPIVVMETPSRFRKDLNYYFHVAIPLTQLKHQLRALVLEEMKGMTHRQRLLMKQIISETLHIIKQIKQNGTANSNLKRAHKLFGILIKLRDLLVYSHNDVPQFLLLVDHQLLRSERLLAQRYLVSQDTQQLDNGDRQVTLNFDIDDVAFYQSQFLTAIDKLLIVSEFLPVDVSELLMAVPKTHTFKREFIRDNTTKVNLVALGDFSFLQHLEALVQTKVGPILVILPDKVRVNHWYQKIRYGLETDYGIVAEGVTGSFNKIHRQTQPNQLEIILVTDQIFDHLWQREQSVPKIVVVPEKTVWQPASRLELLLGKMQRNNTNVLVTQLNAMQRHRFKKKIDIKKFDQKPEILTQKYLEMMKEY